MDGIALMATAMDAAKSRLDVSAANLANVSTDGFHKHLAHVAFTERGLVASSSVDNSQGALKHTGRNFDLAIVGSGGFLVRERGGALAETRTGSFERDVAGHLVDESGRMLMGRHGPVVASANAMIDARGIVRDAGSVAAQIQLRPGTTVQSGFLEGANVDAVREMVDVLEAQRAFETAQKTLGAIDDSRQKDVNDVVRVKS
jgi:flagellar basal-body rod protein FlgF